MSAFQAYTGAYEFCGETFSWRCYATTRVHEVRRRDHGPVPSAPAGRKWVWQSPLHDETEVGWLVDDTVVEFSQILLQVLPQPKPAPVVARSGRRKAVEPAAAM